METAQEAVIFYFSGTGNTRFCAHSLAKALAARGLGARVVSIESPRAAELARTVGPRSLPVFAYPVYGSDIPGPMRRFLRGLPAATRGDGNAAPIPRDAAVFCTQLAFSGDGAALADEDLLPLGYRARWTAHVLMPNNICLSVLRFPYTNDPERLEKARKRAEDTLVRFADAIAGGLTFGHGRGPLSRFLGLLQRGPYRAYARKHARDGLSGFACVSVDPALHALRPLRRALPCRQSRPERRASARIRALRILHAMLRLLPRERPHVLRQTPHGAQGRPLPRAGAGL